MKARFSGCAVFFFSPHFFFLQACSNENVRGKKSSKLSPLLLLFFPPKLFWVFLFFSFFFTCSKSVNAFFFFSKCQRLRLPSHQCNVCASADAVDAPLLCVFPGSATRPELYLCVPFKVAVAYDGRHTSLMPTLLHRGGAGAERWPRKPTANQPHRETTHESLLHLQR